MPAARSNRDRILQISRWLAVTFPTPYPTTVRCVKKIAAPPGVKGVERRIGCQGETYQDGRKIIIRIAVRRGIPRMSTVDTLLHEWAHALLADQEQEAIGGHDVAWGKAFGKIYHRYIDDGGYKASEDY